MLSRNFSNYQSNCETLLQNKDLITQQRKPEIVDIQAASHQQWNNTEIWYPAYVARPTCKQFTWISSLFERRPTCSMQTADKRNAEVLTNTLARPCPLPLPSTTATHSQTMGSLTAMTFRMRMCGTLSFPCSNVTWSARCKNFSCCFLCLIANFVINLLSKLGKGVPQNPTHYLS